MITKHFLIYIRAIFGYISIIIFFPLLWTQGIYLKKVALRLSLPKDYPLGRFKGKYGKIRILGVGESHMAGVGIKKKAETQTGKKAKNINQ